MVFSVCLLSVPCFGFFLLNLSGFVYIFWVSAIMILGISYGARINMPWFVPICSAEFLKPPQSPPYLLPLRSFPSFSYIHAAFLGGFFFLLRSFSRVFGLLFFPPAFPFWPRPGSIQYTVYIARAVFFSP